MMGLNKLGTAITVITAITLVALAVEIVYVLWQRRRSLRPRVRVEPQEASLPCSSSSSPGSTEGELDLDLDLEQHVSKWQCLYGPSRVLFTIKEEEREGLESENGSSAECSAMVVKKSTVTATKSAWLSETVAVDEVAVAVEGLLNETTPFSTPFSTPCASPPYYTPHSSPSREACNKDNNGGNG